MESEKIGFQTQTDFIFGGVSNFVKNPSSFGIG
jgi:hypothetical protein